MREMVGKGLRFLNVFLFFALLRSKHCFVGLLMSHNTSSHPFMSNKPGQLWSQSNKRNLVLKKTKLVLNLFTSIEIMVLL